MAGVDDRPDDDDEAIERYWSFVAPMVQSRQSVDFEQIAIEFGFFTEDGTPSTEAGEQIVQLLVDRGFLIRQEYEGSNYPRYEVRRPRT
jgi:hypothetical protein